MTVKGGKVRLVSLFLFFFDNKIIMINRCCSRLIIYTVEMVSRCMVTLYDYGDVFIDSVHTSIVTRSLKSIKTL